MVVMKTVGCLLIATCMWLLLAGSAQAAANSDLKLPVPGDPPSALPIWPQWDTVAGRSAIPIADMAVVIQGYDSFWPCFTNTTLDFRVLSNDGPKYLDYMSWTGREFFEFNFATDGISTGSNVDWPGPYAYSQSPDRLEKTPWLPRSMWAAAMEHVGLTLNGNDKPLDTPPDLAPLVPPITAYCSRIFLNWHSKFIDHTADLPYDQWWTSRYPTHDMFPAGVFYLDAEPPTAEFSKLTVGPARKGRIPFSLKLVLSDKGSPWAGITYEVKHGSATVQDEFTAGWGSQTFADSELKLPLGCTYTLHVSNYVTGKMPSGRYTIRWRATDVAGNKASGSVPFNVKRAAIDPTVR